MKNQEVFTHISAHGSKGGGGSQHTPVEAADSLHSVSTARILLGLGEGEFDIREISPKTIMLQGTPLQNPDNSWNFPNVKWEVRSGTQAQEVVNGFPAIESEVNVGVDLKASQPWTQTITNLNIDAVNVRIGFPALYSQNSSNGDINGTTVQYHIDVQTDGGAFQRYGDFPVTGKTTSGSYERTHRIDLPKANTSWTIRVVRDTADSTSQMLLNSTTVKAYSLIVDARLRYPHTALLYVEFDARQFQNIPKISVLTRGRIVRVPTNYDPETRTYAGNWNGLFKWAWTNNPAWVFYDLCAEPRFGIGKRMLKNGLPMLDKWELYKIGQRCDQLVPDGLGGSGTQPRFMCDVYVAARADAWQLVKDLSAVFAGMMWWGGGQLNVVSDMPGDVAHVVTRASVINGKITYQSGSQRNHYSTFVVNYCDPQNHYVDRPASGMRTELVKRWGAIQLEMTAIGCTREEEAQRRGQWALITNSYDRTAVWSVGIEGLAYKPGDIVALADERLAGKVMGGRCEASLNQTINLDRKADASVGDSLIVKTRGGAVEKRAITKVTLKADGKTQLFLGTPFNQPPQDDAVFVIDAGQLALQYFRLTAVKYNPDSNSFECNGAEYIAEKYDAIDRGARLDQRPISLIPTNVIAAPSNIKVTSYEAVIGGNRVTTMRSTWNAVLGTKTAAGYVGGAVAYEAQYRRNSNDWVNVPRTGLTAFEIPGIYEGDYYVRVRAINAGEASSDWGNAAMVHLKGRQGDVPKPIGLKGDPLLYGVRWSWAFGPDSDDTSYTELQYKVPGDGQEYHLTNEVYPSNNYNQMGLSPAQLVSVRGRCVDRMGNQSDWTDWVDGMSNSNADDYLAGIADDFLSSEDGKALQEAMNANMAAILQNALANHATVYQQYAQVGAVRASFLQVTTTVATMDKALSEFQQVVNAKFPAIDDRFDDNEAQVNQKLTATVTAASASAMYTLGLKVKWNNVDYTAGMSLGVIPNGSGGYKTRVGFNADEFVLINGATQTSPWAVVGANTFIANALIQNASIDRAKIVTVLSSANWNGQFGANGTGWAIDSSNGNLYLNNINARGNIQATSGSFQDLTATNCTLTRCHILGDCVIDGTLRASQIYGPLMQSKAFNIRITNTNGSAAFTWDGTAGKGDVAMTLHGTITAYQFKQRKAAIDIAGQRPAGIDVGTTTSSSNTATNITVFAFSVDVGTGAAVVTLLAGDLNQGAAESTAFVGTIFASPTANQFH